jgi:hypothetical protein
VLSEEVVIVGGGRGGEEGKERKGRKNRKKVGGENRSGSTEG